MKIAGSHYFNNGCFPHITCFAFLVDKQTPSLILGTQFAERNALTDVASINSPKMKSRANSRSIHQLQKESAIHSKRGQLILLAIVTLATNLESFSEVYYMKYEESWAKRRERWWSVKYKGWAKRVFSPPSIQFLSNSALRRQAIEELLTDLQNIQLNPMKWILGWTLHRLTKDIYFEQAEIVLTIC